MRRLSRRLLSGALLGLLLYCATAAEEFRVDGLVQSGDFSRPEGWELTGYHREADQYLSLKQAPNSRGTASTTFTGPDGVYKIRIKYFDEGDGVSRTTLLIGDRTIGSWVFDGLMADAILWQEFGGVEIKTGEKITLSGVKGGYEYGRLLGIEILPSSAAPRGDAPPEPVATREYSMNLVPLMRHRSIRPSSEMVVAPAPFYTGGAGAYLLLLERGELFDLTCWPAFATSNAHLNYTLTKLGDEKPTAHEDLMGSSPQALHLRLEADQAGVYELKVDPGTGAAPGSGVLVRLDCPAVRKLPASEQGYFFVPAQSQALSVTMSGRAVLLDAAGEVMLDKWLDADTTLRIEVPDGSDDQLWFFQGQLKDLVGAPPYVAARPEQMLVPLELVQEAGK